MNQRERMAAGLPYKAWLDGLTEERHRARRLVDQFNRCRPSQDRKKRRLLDQLLGGHGPSFTIEPPFHCDYGWNIEVGDEFFANFNLTILDVGKVTIGRNVMFGPNVSLLTAGHPIHPVSRNSGYEFGLPITIGNNVWIGGSVVVNPGITVGDNTVIGSGSVVTKDLPANVVAAGNPCRILRTITDQDRNFYFKDRPFDVTDF